jgi:outer membrane murein-binding lipoprotein Lpp
MRLVLMAAVAGTAMLTTCGSGEVVVQVYAAPEGSEPTPVADLPVRALPYDRDALFDSLRTAYGTPEPAVPEELSQLRDSIATMNQQWSVMNARWAEGRDSLRVLSDQLRGMPRMNPQYLPLFNRFNALEREVTGAKQAADQAFARFDAMNKRYITRADEIRLAREQWADAAYADVDRVIDQRLREMRLEEVVDTTDANGIARFNRLRGGDWWVHARYDLPFAELYWNVPLEGSERVELTRENAQVRPKL